MAPSFHLFATDAFDAEEAGRICEQILQRQGTKSKMDLRQQPPAAVLSVLASSGWFRQVFGDKRFCFDDWYQTECHEDGSCRLSVRRPPTKSSRLVEVAAVVLAASANARDGSRRQYIFKGMKDAKHTAAFIITVLTLDHIGGASSRDRSNILPGTRPSSPSQPSSQLQSRSSIDPSGSEPTPASSTSSAPAPAPAPSAPALGDVGSGGDVGGGPAHMEESLEEVLNFCGGLFSDEDLGNDSVLQGLADDAERMAIQKATEGGLVPTPPRADGQQYGQWPGMAPFNSKGGSLPPTAPSNVTDSHAVLMELYARDQELVRQVPPLDLTGQRVAQTPPPTGRDEFRAAKSMKCHQGSATKSAVSELARGSGNGAEDAECEDRSSDDGADDDGSSDSESDDSDSEEDENVIVLGEERVSLPNGHVTVMKRKNQATTWAVKFTFLGTRLFFGTSYPTKKKAEKALKMGRVLFREEVQKTPNVSKDELKRDLKRIAATVKVKCQKVDCAGSRTTALTDSFKKTVTKRMDALVEEEKKLKPSTDPVKKILQDLRGPHDKVMEDLGFPSPNRWPFMSGGGFGSGPPSLDDVGVVVGGSYVSSAWDDDIDLLRNGHNPESSFVGSIVKAQKVLAPLLGCDDESKAESAILAALQKRCAVLDQASISMPANVSSSPARAADYKFLANETFSVAADRIASIIDGMKGLKLMVAMGKTAGILYQIAIERSKREEKPVLFRVVHPQYANDLAKSGRKGRVSIGGKSCVSRFDAILYMRAHFELLKQILPSAAAATEMDDDTACRMYESAHCGSSGISSDHPLSEQKWERIEDVDYSTLTEEEIKELEGWYIQKHKMYFRSGNGALVFRGKKTLLYFVKYCDESMSTYMREKNLKLSSVAI